MSAPTAVLDAGARGRWGRRDRRSRQSWRGPWQALWHVNVVQRRRALVWFALLAAALAVAIVIATVQIQHAIGADPCGTSLVRCVDAHNYLADHSVVFTGISIALRALPVMVGMFFGAPLLSRELENGTFRFSWTQATTRRRQVGTTLVLLAGAVVAVSVALGLLFGWLAHPYNAISSTSQWTGGQFETTPVLLAAWGVTGLLAGTFIGGLARRQVPAMAVSAVVLGGAWLCSAVWVIPRLLSVAPLLDRHASPVLYPSGSLHMVATRSSGHAGSWLVYGRFVGSHGAQISNTTILKMLRTAGDEKEKPWKYIAAHHVSYFLTYQPASRFWMFQGAELVVLLVLCALLVAGVMRRLRHA